MDSIHDPLCLEALVNNCDSSQNSVVDGTMHLETIPSAQQDSPHSNTLTSVVSSTDADKSSGNLFFLNKY